MAHPYPPHLETFDYRGKYHYALTFRVADDTRPFAEGDKVFLVWQQILRAAREKGFEIVAYCFMPDHLHLLVRGCTDQSDAKRFIRAAKQYSGYYYSQQFGAALWQRYGYERVVRDDFERSAQIGYILDNPVRAGLADHPCRFAHLGSEVYTVEELIRQSPEPWRWEHSRVSLPAEAGSHGE